ncbi:MAG: hypothetical protein V3U68_07520 [Bacteroidota bacterium]
MDPGSLFYLSVILGFVGFGLITRWYLMPALSALPLERSLRPLLLLHSFRFIGLAFAVPGVVSPDLPSSFANPAAYGDLLAALLALVSLAALRFRWALALPLVWLFNLEGTLDLLYAFFQGFRSQVHPGYFGAMYFVPTVVVPALITTHVIIFRLLLQSKKSEIIRTSSGHQ